MRPYENNNDNDNDDDNDDDNYDDNNNGGGCYNDGEDYDNGDDDNEGYNIEIIIIKIIIIVLIANDLYTVHHTISHHSSLNRSLHVFITKSILNDRQSFLAYNKKQ